VAVTREFIAAGTLRALGVTTSVRVGSLPQVPTIAAALDLRLAEVTRLGGDVALRLRPTRHTGDRSRD